MNRFHALLSLLLVALVSSAWVIKDTANPVDIYTGSNTTPTIAGATSGAVTLGPSGFAGIHSIGGDIDMLTSGGGGLEIQRVGETVVGRLFISASGDSLVLSSESNHPLELRTNNTAVFNATGAGSVTLGPSGFTGSHTINGSVTSTMDAVYACYTSTTTFARLGRVSFG